jgi:AcrR family transcriptional regulator
MAKASPRSTDGTRQAIVDAAYYLFRQRGFARVSLDDIALGATVTKRTLYNHFTSKDALLGAVLEGQSALAFQAFQSFGKAFSGTPEEIVDELFAELVTWSAKPRWAGSGFTRLAIELADLPGHPARTIARRHKAALEEHLAELLEGAGLEHAVDRSREIYLLVEGAMSLMLIHNDATYVTTAADAAKRLLRGR